MDERLKLLNCFLCHTSHAAGLHETWRTKLRSYIIVFTSCTLAVHSHQHLIVQILSAVIHTHNTHAKQFDTHTHFVSQDAKPPGFSPCLQLSRRGTSQIPRFCASCCIPLRLQTGGKAVLNVANSPPCHLYKSKPYFG
jgi:hypothetical protein